MTSIKEDLLLLQLSIEWHLPNRPFAQLLPGLETGHPVKVGQSPTYDFRVSDEQKAVFLVSVSNPGNNSANGLLWKPTSGTIQVTCRPTHYHPSIHRKKTKLNQLLIQVIRMQFNEELHHHLHHNHDKSLRVFKLKNQFQVLFRCACLAVI